MIPMGYMGKLFLWIMAVDHAYVQKCKNEYYFSDRYGTK
jgi:hypothetical protein